jgi:hypothetical protein
VRIKVTRRKRTRGAAFQANNSELQVHRRL